MSIPKNIVRLIPKAEFQAGNAYTVVVTGKATGSPKLEALIVSDKLEEMTSAAITRDEYEKNKES